VHEVQIDEITVPSTQLSAKSEHTSGFPERYKYFSNGLVSTNPVGMELMSLSLNNNVCSNGLLSTIPTGIIGMALPPKYKNFSALLLSTIPTGIKVILLPYKYRCVINASPSKASTGMKEIAFLLNSIIVVVAIHTVGGTCV